MTPTTEESKKENASEQYFTGSGDVEENKTEEGIEDGTEDGTEDGNEDGNEDKNEDGKEDKNEDGNEGPNTKGDNLVEGNEEEIIFEEKSKEGNNEEGNNEETPRSVSENETGHGNYYCYYYDDDKGRGGSKTKTGQGHEDEENESENENEKKKKKEEKEEKDKKEKKKNVYPEDSYSFLALYDIKDQPSLVCLGWAVFFIQSLLPLYMILSIVVPKWRTMEEADNSTGSFFGAFMPVDSEKIVQAAQITSLVAYVMLPGHSLTDVALAIRMFPRFDGQQNNNEKNSNEETASERNARRLALSCILRLVPGILATIAVFLLVMISSNVVEIILNFTAVDFISGFDNRAFKIAEEGKYGSDIEKQIQTMKKKELPKGYQKRSENNQGYLYILFSFFIIFLVIVSLVVRTQKRGWWIKKIVRVEFEESRSSSFSGCYSILGNEKHDTRFIYNHNNYNENSQPAKLGYCKKERRWLFYQADDKNVDPCNAYGNINEIAHSPKTDAFDIGKSIDEDWFTVYNTPMEMYFIQEDDELLAANCDQSLGDGQCSVDFNNLNFKYDGGACCASTCTGSECGKDNLTDDIVRYPRCTDPTMVPIVIFQSNKTSMSNSNGLLKLDCDGYNVFTIIESTFESIEPAMIERGSDCTLFSISNDTSITSIMRFRLDEDDFDFEELDYGAEKYFKVWPIFDQNKTNFSLSEVSEDLNLYGSVLRGQLPEHIGLLKTLRRLSLDYNSLTGTIPSEIGQLKSLQVFDLNYNSLTGTIPSEIGQLESLQGLYLRYNSLTGTIPSEIGQLKSLEHLYLDDNSLTGTIPSEIGQLKSLEHLSLLSLNLVKDYNSLTGTIPSEIGQLKSLEHLSLYYNSLTGTIPSEIGQLESLQGLYLVFNSLTGTIPSEIGQLESLERLYLDANSLTGTIPSEIGQLKSLQRLYLDYNSLTGKIPSEIGQLKSLEHLSLFFNSLTGTIPSEIGQLESLQVFDLNANSLTGTIPYCHIPDTGFRCHVV